MFHARLRDFGIATGAWDPQQGGTNIAAAIGTFCTVKVTQQEGTKKPDAKPEDPVPLFNRIDGFQPFATAAPAGPAAPGAGLPPAPAASAYVEPGQEYAGTHGTDQTGYDPHTDSYAPAGGLEGSADDDGLPF